MEWKKTLMVTGGVAALIGAALTVPIVSSNSRSIKARETRSSSIVSREVSSLKGTDLGIVYVSNVQELQNAIRTASDFETIVVTKKGSPYVLSELPCMHTNGYLYVTNSITIRGETGNPNEVVIGGEYEYYDENITNRIFYIKAQGCKIDGLSIRNGNCTTNEYHKYGGGVYRGGAIYLALSTNECLISNCNFFNNEAQSGGAIACSRRDDDSTTISGCVFNGNHANENGGAIYNGGTIDNCKFIGNISEKYGGAVCYGNVISSSGDTYNQAMSNKGSELYGCTAIGYEYAGGNGMVPGSYPMSRFHDCLLDRCRLCATNGVLFSGWYDVRSSTITDGTNFALSVASPGKWDVEYWQFYPSRLINCTIANNKNYSLLTSGTIGEQSLQIYNTIFAENSTLIDIGWVNLNLATNDYYKTRNITYAERYVALGWGGEYRDIYPYQWDDTLETDGGDTIYINKEQLNETMIEKKVYDATGESSFTVSLSYEEYYYVHGWNGDTSLTSFTSKPSKVTIKPYTNSRYNTIQSNWTTEESWRDYYSKQDVGGRHWDGVSKYIYHEVVDNCAFSLSISNVFVRADAQEGTTAGIQGTSFSIADVEYEQTGAGRDVWYSGSDYYNSSSYQGQFYFAGNSNPQNPYLISTESVACHLYWAFDYWYTPVLEDWMQTGKDLRGEPRLTDGKLDLGAYQAVEYRKPTKFIIRIR